MKRKFDAWLESNAVIQEERKELFVKRIRESVSEGDFETAFIQWQRYIACINRIKEGEEFKKFLFNEQNGN